jgi:hypothetical protein
MNENYVVNISYAKQIAVPIELEKNDNTPDWYQGIKQICPKSMVKTYLQVSVSKHAYMAMKDPTPENMDKVKESLDLLEKFESEESK